MVAALCMPTTQAPATQESPTPQSGRVASHQAVFAMCVRPSLETSRPRGGAGRRPASMAVLLLLLQLSILQLPGASAARGLLIERRQLLGAVNSTSASGTLSTTTTDATTSMGRKAGSDKPIASAGKIGGGRPSQLVRCGVVWAAAAAAC